jgi:hypothetical protein
LARHFSAEFVERHFLNTFRRSFFPVQSWTFRETSLCEIRRFIHATAAKFPVP